MIDAVDSQSLTLTGQYTTSGQQKVVAETTECYVETSNGVWFNLSLAFPIYIDVSSWLRHADSHLQWCLWIPCVRNCYWWYWGCDATSRVAANVHNLDIYTLVVGFQGTKGNFDLIVSITFEAVTCWWKGRIQDVSFCYFLSISFCRNLRMMDAMTPQTVVL